MHSDRQQDEDLKTQKQIRRRGLSSALT